MAKELEMAFIARIRGHIEEGMNFAEVVQETLATDMGETPSAVLFQMIGKSGVTSPELFASRLSLVLGGGAETVFASVEKNASRWRELGSEPSVSAYESLMASLVLTTEAQNGSSGTVLLHNHRIKDEFGVYAEDA